MRLDCLAPFPLRSATLPLTGENHPLRREFNKWMSWGNASTLLIATFALCTILLLPKEQIAVTPQIKFEIDDWERYEPPINVEPHKPQPPAGRQQETGYIAPTANFDPDTDPFPALKPIPGSTGLESMLPREGDVWAIDPPQESALPGPEVFVLVEVYPEKLRMDAPIYPELAREAGIEGTVVLRILVSKEGRVLDCIVMSGNPMLVLAAITAARTAVFSPALQAQKPVAVWVQLPIVFSLK